MITACRQEGATLDKDAERFPNLEAAAAALGGRTSLSLAELRALLCYDCDFYGDDHEEELECSCFRMLRILISRGKLTPESLAAALAAKKEGPPR